MVRRFNNLKFQTKIFLLCLMVSLIPTSVLGVFCYNQLNTLLIEREQTALYDSIMQESLNISSQLSTYQSISEYIVWDSDLNSVFQQTYGTNSQMYRAYTQKIDPLFSTIKHLNPGVTRITIFTDLDIYPSSGVLEPLDQIENYPWYQEVSDTANALWVHSMEDNSLSVVQRFIDTPKNISAYLVLRINTEELFSNLTTLYSSSYGVLVTDADGYPICQYHTNDLQDTIMSFPKLTGDTLSDSTNNNYIVETVKEQNSDWTYYIIRPIETVRAATQIIISTTLIIIVFCLFFIFLFSYLLSHSLVQPLEKLTKNIKQVASGNYEIAVIPHSSDEVGQLIDNFTYMVHQLNQLINETLKSKIAQQKMQFRALQAQINPHFLYNTLSLINSQSILVGHPEIGLPARYMATFYRTSLNKGKDLILVKEELENIKSYINIQLLMHSDSFDVYYDIDEDILSFSMPNLMLQPLVENAIIHGIDYLETNRRGRLEITAKASGENLFFIITDNGCGIPEDKLANILLEQTNGYGIKNVHTRAQLQYGSEYGLSYKSRVGSGTEVTLTIAQQTMMIS